MLSKCIWNVMVLGTRKELWNGTDAETWHAQVARASFLEKVDESKLDVQCKKTVLTYVWRQRKRVRLNKDEVHG